MKTTREEWAQHLATLQAEAELLLPIRKELEANNPEGLILLDIMNLEFAPLGTLTVPGEEE